MNLQYSANHLIVYNWPSPINLGSLKRSNSDWNLGHSEFTKVKTFCETSWQPVKWCSQARHWPQMTPFIQIPAAFISPWSKCPESPNYQISQKPILPFQFFSYSAEPLHRKHTSDNTTEFEWEQGNGVHEGVGGRNDITVL